MGNVFSEMEKMKKQGNRVPAVCFWAFNGPVITVVQDLFDSLYKKQRYKDLWFYWDGKPLLLYNATPSADANASAAKNPNPHYDPRPRPTPSIRTTAIRPTANRSIRTTPAK